MRLRRPNSDESGAIAVLTALLMVVVLAIAALGVDIATQVNESQKLHDTIDAAALAGAYRLPGTPALPATLAEPDARANALKNDPTLSLPTTPVNAVAFLCVVASKASGSAWVVDTAQIPSTCDPRPYSITPTPPPCNSAICAIPCFPAAGNVCNTVKVSGTKTVPFSFAPVIGINSGSTGSVTSAACKGSCGTIPNNPMDVVVVADRTSSMEQSGSIPKLVGGIKGMLQEMTPSQQYVALGTIGRSAKTGHSTAACDSTNKGLSWPSNSATTGDWVPVQFSNDYLTGTSLNTSSSLVKAVECLSNPSGTGTNLASPLKAAARYLLGPSSTYDSTTTRPAGASARIGTVRKAIIFETDGIPKDENNGGGTAVLSNALDIGSSNISGACTNLRDVATNAKAAPANILVVTVAFDVSTAVCSSAAGDTLVNTLAATASPAASGANSSGNYNNNNNCRDPSDRVTENNDGDNFFCSAPGEDMASIFQTAFLQIANGSRLIELPPGA